MATTSSPRQPSSQAHSSQADYLADVEAVREAAAVYYNHDDAGTVLMDDGAYDALVAALKVTEEAHPDWVVENSPTGLVGAGVALAGTVEHLIPMLSLDNLFAADEVLDWVGSRERLLGAPVSGFVVEPKYDGNACSALYENGRLVRIATRGDGTTGEDRTYAVDRIKNLPRTLTRPFSGEVRGEVEFLTSDYEAASEARVAAGKPAYANARNGGAGAFGAETLSHPVSLTFFPYSIDGADGVGSHRESLELMFSLGFTSPARHLIRECAGAADVQEAIADLAAARADLGFAIDGAVIKVNLLAEQERLGLASRAPRWGIAFKYPPDTAISVLEEVIWQVGRTGVIAPRARITPVVVGGTQVTYTTLHNVDDITRKGFLLGDHVTVLRAGEVIPRLEAPLVNMRTGAETPIEVPSVCPRCGGELNKTQARWRCVQGRNCGLAESIDYATSRDALDIEGMGTTLVRQLVAAGSIVDVADIFSLTLAQLTSLERVGETSATKVLAEIDGAKSKPLSRVLTALGIRGTGRSMSRRIARHFGSMEALRAATVEELVEVEGIGPEKAPVIVEELAELAAVIDRLVAAGVNMTEPGTAGRAVAGGAVAGGGAAGEESTQGAREGSGGAVELPFAGKTVCVSGTVPGLSRTAAQEAVEALGGKSSSSVSARTDLLVAGPGAGSKLAKAESLGVAVMDSTEFASLVAAHNLG